MGRLVRSPPGTSAGRGDSGFRLVSGPQAAFDTRLALIQAASRTLDLQYYAIHADQSTATLIARLREAAQRGVRVRILLDDLNSVGPDAQLMLLTFEKNIEIRMFNPLTGSRASLLTRGLGSLTNLSRIQRRMHNKLFLADNALAIAGGRNLGDAYFGRAELANFVDLDMLVTGPLVRTLSVSFDTYWNDPLAYPVERLMSKQELLDLRASADRTGGTAESTVAMPAPPAAAAAATPASTQQALDLLRGGWTWADAVVLADKPAKIVDEEEGQAQETVLDGLLDLMRQARRDVLIISPYFVPGEQLLGVLAALRQRGVTVRVLTNSMASTDAPLAHAGYARYRLRLLGLGVQLYEMRSQQTVHLRELRSSVASNSALHAKAVIVDGRTLAIGSMNLDLRSRRYNTELALVIRSAAIAAGAAAGIEPAMQHGAYRLELSQGRVVWHGPVGAGLDDGVTEPDSSLAARILLALLGPFAPEELL